MSVGTVQARAADAVMSGLDRLQWRMLLTEPMSGAENMAGDMALMDRARSTGEAVLRVYSWSEPTLSFGRNQKTSGYDREAIRDAGIGVVRRPTGGRAILHHREITYSVTAPAAPGERIGTAYDWINALLVSALRSLGVPAELAPRTVRSPAPDEHPCFFTATPGEITARGRKLVGSAQYREDGAILQHGSILIADDQSSIAVFGGVAAAVPPATLEQIVGRAPAPAELHAALRESLEREGLAPSTLDADELASSMAGHAAAFGDPQWTWRR